MYIPVGKSRGYSSMYSIAGATVILVIALGILNAFTMPIRNFLIGANGTLKTVDIKDVLVVTKKKGATMDGKVALGTYLVQKVNLGKPDYSLTVVELDHPTGNSPFPILYTDICDSYEDLNFTVLEPGDIGYDEILKKAGDI